MSEEEWRSSLASTAATPITTEPTDQVPTGGGWPHRELQVAVSRPVEGLDMIDNLAQPTTCSLVVMIKGSFQIKVGKELVYPYQTLLDDVQIDASSYVVVKVDMVHENVKNMKLEVSPDDTTLTLWDAITRRVKWRRTYIDIDSSAIASASTTASQPNTAPGSIFPKTQPDQM
jgi:hypothetical protein